MAGMSILLTPKDGLLLIDGGSATNDNKTIGMVPEEMCGRYVECSFFVDFDHTSSAGVVTIESAPYRNYAGLWVSEGVVTWSAIDKAHRVSLNLLAGAMRARITTTVTAGTASVRFFASTNS